MAITPEREAELKAELEEIIERHMGHQMERPKVVATKGDVVRDADVKVSRADPNYKGNEGVVTVRRNDWVTVNMGVYEQQMREKADERRRRRELDPYRMGLYGPVDDE